MSSVIKTQVLQEPSSTSENIVLGASGDTYLNSTSGNVGVGTISPTYKLDVKDGAIRVYNSAGTDADLRFANNASTAGKITYTSQDMAFFTAGSERMRIEANGYMQGTVNGLAAGRIPAMQFFRLDSNLAGANVATAQSVFGVGVTLVGSTQYAFGANYVFTKTAGATSHTFGFGFGGTAVVNNILYGGDTNGGSAAGVSTGAATFNSNTASNTTATASIATASVSVIVHIKGTISIGTGGTLIPQYTLSAAPGGAYSTVTGSYFAIWPLAASGSNVNIGSWA